MRCASTLVAATMACAMSACEASGGPGMGGTYTRYPLIAIRGRLVSLESCFDASGCRGVENLEVAMLADPERKSPITSRSGAFVIEDLPAGVYLDLVASQGGAGLDWVPTINARVVPPATDDVYDVDVYAVPRDAESMFIAWRETVGAPLDVMGGVIVLVVASDPDNPQLDEAVAGARVELHPAPSEQRYVNVLPRFVGSTGAEDPFLPEDAAATGPFGLSVATWTTTPDTVAAVVTGPDHRFSVALTEVRAGRISFVIARGTPLSAAVPTRDAGPARDAGATRDAATDAARP